MGEELVRVLGMRWRRNGVLPEPFLWIQVE